MQGQVSGTSPVLSVISTNANEGLNIKTLGTGSLKFIPGTDSVNAFLFRNAADNNTILRVDTTNLRVGIGAAPVVALDVAGAIYGALASTTAFVIGPNRATNPTFQVDTSVASVATGLNIKGAAAGAGLAVSVLSSTTPENLTIDAKGTGTITLNATATGKVTIGNGFTVTTGGGTISAGGLVVTAGNIAVGTSLIGSDGIVVASTALTGATQIGVAVSITNTSAATANAVALYGKVTGGSGTYTSATVAGLTADTNVKGANQSVTANYGVLVASQTMAASVNYGIFLGANSGASVNNYGLYITAPTGTGAIGLFNGGTSTLVGAITAQGLISTYNNVATVGMGVPAIYGLDSRTGLTTADGATTTLYATTASNQIYRVSADIFATAAVTGTATYTITWTENSTTQTMTVTATVANTLGTASNIVRPDNATNITSQLTGTFTGTFTVVGLVERLA